MRRLPENRQRARTRGKKYSLHVFILLHITVRKHSELSLEDRMNVMEQEIRSLRATNSSILTALKKQKQASDEEEEMVHAVDSLFTGSTLSGKRTGVKKQIIFVRMMFIAPYPTDNQLQFLFLAEEHRQDLDRYAFPRNT